MPKQIQLGGDLGSPSIKKTALAWTKIGGKVLALHGIDDRGKCTCGRKDCRNPGKHPIGSEFPHGYKSATKSSRKIGRVFDEHSHANLGVVLPERIIVLDVDGPTGKKTFKGLDLPKTAFVMTGRGRHYYYSYNQTLPEKFKSLDGIDIKTHEKGYIVVSPSVHHSGKKYSWANSKSPQFAKHLSSSNLKKIADQNSGKIKLGNVSKLKAGDRNNSLTGIAGYLRYKALSSTAIDEALQAINRKGCSPPLDEDEVSSIAASIGTYPTGYEDAFGELAEVVEEEVQFLAFPYIVKGATTVIDGHMGQGKSTFTVALAAAVTTGNPPPFLKKIEKGTVLFLSAEDDAARVLKPRLVENGADVSKIRYQEKIFTLDESGMLLLRQEISSNTPALVVIDPIIAYMDAGIDGNKANETMRFMVELDGVAREFDTSILIVRHMRKAKADHAMHQGIGSIAISARVRSGLMLGIHPNDPNLRAVVHSKYNYTEPGPAMVFELKRRPKKVHAKLIWHPVDESIEAEDLLVKPEADRGRPAAERDHAIEFLRKVLAKGPLDKQKLQAMAQARSITEATLRRASADQKIQKSRKNGKSFWALP